MLNSLGPLRLPFIAGAAAIIAAVFVLLNGDAYALRAAVVSAACVVVLYAVMRALAARP